MNGNEHDRSTRETKDPKPAKVEREPKPAPRSFRVGDRVGRVRLVREVRIQVTKGDGVRTVAVFLCRCRCGKEKARKVSDIRKESVGCRSKACMNEAKREAAA